MKTESEILSEFYKLLSGSSLHNLAGGDVIKSPNVRKQDSKTDDIVILALSGNLAQIQECDININVFVHDVYDKGQPVPSPKVTKLERAALDILESIVQKDYNVKLVQQHTYKVAGVDQHCINNRIYYRTTN